MMIHGFLLNSMVQWVRMHFLAHGEMWKKNKQKTHTCTPRIITVPNLLSVTTAVICLVSFSIADIRLKMFLLFTSLLSHPGLQDGDMASHYCLALLPHYPSHYRCILGLHNNRKPANLILKNISQNSLAFDISGIICIGILSFAVSTVTRFVTTPVVVSPRNLIHQCCLSVLWKR